MAALRIGMIGGGQMGTALVHGVIRAECAGPQDIVVADVSDEARERLAAEAGVRTTADGAEATQGADVVVIAVKPQIAPVALAALAGSLGPTQTVLSIAAGLSIERIEELLQPTDKAAASPAHVVRAMPNTPALVGKGISAVSAGPHATEDDVARVVRILSAVGQVVRVDEAQMDAVTGLSGSGPAFVYTVIEALADGGVGAGLAKPLALTLAAQTVLGAASMVLETDEHPAVLRDRVTSPGGTTIAGLHAAEKQGLRAALMNAVRAAAERSAELGS